MKFVYYLRDSVIYLNLKEMMRDHDPSFTLLLLDLGFPFLRVEGEMSYCQTLPPSPNVKG